MTITIWYGSVDVLNEKDMDERKVKEDKEREEGYGATV